MTINTQFKSKTTTTKTDKNYFVCRASFAAGIAAARRERRGGGGGGGGVVHRRLRDIEGGSSFEDQVSHFKTNAPERLTVLTDRKIAL